MGGEMGLPEERDLKDDKKEIHKRSNAGYEACPFP